MRRGRLGGLKLYLDIEFQQAYKVYCNVRSKIRIIGEDISQAHCIELQKPCWVTSVGTRSKMFGISTKCSLQQLKNLQHENFINGKRLDSKNTLRIPNRVYNSRGLIMNTKFNSTNSKNAFCRPTVNESSQGIHTEFDLYLI